MSASSKKKLRSAEQAMQLTERQRTEQKEAKKLKIFSIVMVAVMVLMVVFAVSIVASKVITKANLGKNQRETVAVTVGEHEISAAEFNCYFVDAVSSFYSNYGSYASLFGLDVTKPLDQQVYDEEAGTTWADEFTATAKEDVKAIYGIVDAAAANGFSLSDDDKAYIDSQMSNIAASAIMYGFSNTEEYLQAMYGTGVNEEIVRKYIEARHTAQRYENSVADSLEFTDADLQAKDNENPNVFSTFSYNYYYLNTSKFLEGGVEDAEGNKTYSDAEQAAALAAAEAAAKSLVEGTNNVEQLNIAIAALPINAEATSATSTTCTDYSYDYVSDAMKEWVTDSSRQAGDMTYLPSVSTADDGTETISGYYVVYFTERNNNEMLLQNVRHILAKFEGGTTDESGATTYSDEEKAAAKEAADAIYAEWKAGEATEESFAALANEKSDDGDGTTGGLYEDIYPGQMVPAFNDWCFDASRQAGDTDVVETEYGYHIMYYVGASEQTYRAMQIENTLINEAVQAWYDEIVSAVTLTEGSLEYVPTGMILSSGN